MTATTVRGVARQAGGSALLGGAAWGAGTFLALVGARLGPAVMVGLPLCGALLVAVLRRPLLGLGMVFGSAAVGLAALPGVPLGLQVTHLVAFAVAGAVVVRRVVDGRPPLGWCRPMWWTVGLAVWTVLATLRGIDPALSLKHDANLLAGLLLALVALAVVQRPPEARWAAWALVLGGTLVTAPSLLSAGQLSASYGGSVVNNRLQGSFAQPNELGAFSMVVLVIAAGLLLGSSGRQRFLAGAAALPALGALGLSLSRGAWIGTALAGIAMLVLLPAARRAVLLVGLPLLLVGAAASTFAPEQPQVQVVGQRLATLRDPASNPYDGRTRIWAEARRETLLEPATGHGPGSFPTVSTRSASQAQTVQADHAHSVLLTVSSELGLPAVVLLIGFTFAVGYAVRDGLARAAPRDAALLAALAASCVGVAGQGLVDFVQRNPVLMLTQWALVGLTLAASRAAQRNGAVTVPQVMDHRLGWSAPHAGTGG